ncbi:cobalamin biosynthesis protein [Microvirga flavescens]|uniref:cobalamin biosynthesis protein n=1 Tax=Microvirga flavescens TaxID=2249811 RepID=UPI0018E0B40A|nr:cobalamin biosynthesis protein [Microvirga flavescens]
MIIAGVGFRHGVTGDEIAELVRQAFAHAAVSLNQLAGLATIEALANRPAFSDAAIKLSVKPLAVGKGALASSAPQVRTISPRALVAHGVGSVAEAAALGAVGPGARLVLERVASPNATCALASTGSENSP